MIRSNLRLKALGLCAMVLGLMAFSASGAQAEPESRWMINGANVEGASPLLATIDIAEIENKSAALLTIIGGTKVDFLCISAKLIGAKLENEGKVTNGGKVKFTGCITLLGGLSEKPSVPCVPKAGGQPFGTIESNAGKGLLVLHEGKPLTRIEPSVAGGPFATLEFGEECSLPEKVPVFGKLFLKDCKDEGKVELVKHLIEQGPLTHLFVISDTVEHAANIDGSAFVQLEGAHSGLKFSGLPG